MATCTLSARNCLAIGVLSILKQQCRDSDCLKIVLRLNGMDLIVICHCLLKRQSINDARSVLYGILSTLVMIPRMQPA